MFELPGEAFESLDAQAVLQIYYIRISGDGTQVLVFFFLFLSENIFFLSFLFSFLLFSFMVWQPYF